MGGDGSKYLAGAVGMDSICAGTGGDRGWDWNPVPVQTSNPQNDVCKTISTYMRHISDFGLFSGSIVCKIQLLLISAALILMR